MPAAKLNLKIEQGATFRQSLDWKANGVAINLTGFEARMQLRQPIDSPTIIHELTTANGGITFTDPSTGKFELFISNIDTAGFNFSTCVYDLEMVAPNTDVTRLIEGTITLSKEVTR
ncbi:hypothetical protein [Acinetobacter ursingii]|uniref:hypothetical protein n=1 Tax=Acinetobacter ursingii TaxID=108980 RepID=UPI002448475C|nr:hypothetical protein [Acinetobacter ursingii]MDG9992339.1 hypothetical protein [Acinetobacter ursingii]MDH0204330.1 hypothetical protein [Acinetobacter ursingii]